jgi:hypothetical protein
MSPSKTAVNWQNASNSSNIFASGRVKNAVKYGSDMQQGNAMERNATFGKGC